MNYFITHDNQGNIITTGDTTDPTYQPAPGLTLIDISHNPNKDTILKSPHLFKIQNGKPVDNPVKNQ